jgi:phage terminase Nu1 subunit (DNA packaging protein)
MQPDAFPMTSFLFGDTTMIVSKRVLAATFGISERGLTTLQRAGLPIEQRATRRGQSHRYDTGAVHRWLLARELAKHHAGTNGDAVPLDEARSRLAQAQTALAELKLRIASGELTDSAQVRLTAFQGARVARDRILALADRLAPVLAAESDEHRVYLALQTEGRAVCAELAGMWDAAPEAAPTLQ